MRSSLLLAGVMVCVLSNMCVASNTDATFAEWCAEYHKSYSSPTEQRMRHGVFLRNKAMIQAHNADPTATFTMALNQFSDLRSEEWIQRYSSSQGSEHVKEMLQHRLATQPPQHLEDAELPTSVNWNASGVFGPIRDDGVCGCAWAFTVTETVTALEVIVNGSRPVALSPQQLVDCTQQSPWDLNGCHGGWPQTAYDYVTEEGLCTEESYPYHASAGECITNCTTHVQPHTVSYGALKATEASFMQQLVKQPVMTAIGLTAGVQHYSSGVYTAPCDVSYQHCVTIAGYGTTTSGVDYWLIRNNFGASWGQDGFLYLGRGIQYPGNVTGQCDVLGLGLYPTIVEG